MMVTDLSLVAVALLTIYLSATTTIISIKLTLYLTVDKTSGTLKI